MHELSVCRSLVRQIEKVAEQHPQHQVTRVQVQVGLLSGIEPKLLQMAYPMAVADTPFATSLLEIEVVPVRVHCEPCGHEAEVAINQLLCPMCHSSQTTVIAGQEMLLTHIGLK